MTYSVDLPSRIVAFILGVGVEVRLKALLKDDVSRFALYDLLKRDDLSPQ